jgi:hypothetical protein
MDWKLLLGAMGAVAAWLWSVYTWRENQALQRSQSEYQRKEQLYREMLKSMAAFYKGNTCGTDRNCPVPGTIQTRLAVRTRRCNTGTGLLF